MTSPELPFIFVHPANVLAARDIVTAIQSNPGIDVVFPLNQATSSANDVYLQQYREEQQEAGMHYPPRFMTVGSWVNEFAKFADNPVSEADRQQIALGVAAVLSAEKFNLSGAGGMQNG